jgi:anti-sigma regulatory factor (Ser/Thr protein kinase)
MSFDDPALAASGELDSRAGLMEISVVSGAAAPAAARHAVRRWLGARTTESVRIDAPLVVSELVTNSVLHSGAAAGEDVTVRLRALAPRCRIEVEDPGRGGAIAPRTPDPLRGGGMGLHLVAAMSECWGVIRNDDGPSRVWAQLLDADGAGQD